MSEKKGLFARLREGLSKTRDQLTGRVDTLVKETRKIDEDFYEELEDILLLSDCGMKATMAIMDELRARVEKDKVKDAEEARSILKQIMIEQMDIPRPPLRWPMVMMVVGVNGVGKTTTIGKLALRFQSIGRRIILCAADTFRAAAAEQLTVWAQRARVPIVKHAEGADPAAVVFDGIKSAKSQGADLLIVDTAGRLHNKKNLMDELRARVESGKVKDAEEAKNILKQIMVEQMDIPRPALRWPMVMMVVGVNGVGKTTTIGKLALRFQSIGRRIILCAADTFRAAAAEQLTVWAQRARVPIVKHAEGADPAAVVFDGIKSAKAQGADLLIVDTAGRLHNKKNLMDELNKMRRVIDREWAEAEVRCMLVLDATTGQNGLAQARAFKEVCEVGGIILTKLDGTAKGGIALAIRQELEVPVWYICVGEGIDDLQPFNAKEFVDALF